MAEINTRIRRHRENRFRARGLGAAATGLAVSAAASDASATIISTPPSQIGPYVIGDTISLGGGALGEIELVSTTAMGMGGGLDLFFEGPGGMGSLSTVELVSFAGMGMNDFLSALSSSDSVDSSLSYSGTAYLLDRDVESPGWPAPTTAYAGFVFTPDGVNPVYGWFELSVSADSTTFEVSEWAYQDDGTPITAGFIPEPSTALLMGLGLAGLAASVRKYGRPARVRSQTPSAPSRPG
jgi:hypothetical protein